MSFPDRLKEFEKCLERFEEVLKLEKNDIVRDSAIKRFELCFELCWKVIKDFMLEEGIICKSPKNCFKEAYRFGLIDDEEEWLSMIEDRNLSVHTYDEFLAETLYGRLNDHLIAMKQLLNNIRGGKDV